VDGRIDQFTQSDRFQQLWTDANRRAHTRVVALLEGGRSKRLVLQGNTVYLDLSSVVDRVRDGLRSRGLDRIADAIPPTVNGQVALFSSDALPKAQRGVRLLKALAIVLPIIALLALIGSAALTKPWRRGVIHAAVGLAVAMLLLIAALAVARSAYLSALDQGVLPRDAAEDIFDQVAALLRHGIRIVVGAALALALLAFVAGLPLRRAGEAAWARVVASPIPAFFARHRDPLLIGVGALGLLVLFVWSPLTGGVVLTVLILAALACGAILGVAAAGRPNGVMPGHPAAQQSSSLPTKEPG
jgi:hypothetical protein